MLLYVQIVHNSFHFIALFSPTVLQSNLTFRARGSTLVVRMNPRTVREKIFLMAVDP